MSKLNNITEIKRRIIQGDIENLPYEVMSIAEQNERFRVALLYIRDQEVPFDKDTTLHLFCREAAASVLKL